MPEEESFAVLVKIMKDYGMREMFKPSMTELGLCMYQLDTLIEQHMPDLHVHFQVKFQSVASPMIKCWRFDCFPVSGNPHQPVRQPVVSHIIHFFCLRVIIKQVRTSLLCFRALFILGFLGRILDSFLCEGREVLFRLALTLLMMAKSDLLQKDIEGVTKVWRNPNCNQLTD